VLSRGSVGWRIAGGSGMPLLTFFSRFFAFGVCVGLSAGDRNVGTLLRRLIAAGLTSIVPLVVFLLDCREQQGGRAGTNQGPVRAMRWTGPRVSSRTGPSGQ
jgi:hypothetical protein